MLKDDNKVSIHVLEFDYRMRKVHEEIEQSMPDIIALQEVDHSHQISQFLQNIGYDLFISPKEKEYNYVTGLIAFKKDEYKLEHIEQIDYKKFITTHQQKAKQIGLNNMPYQYQFALVLRHIQTNKPIIVSNSHFHYNPKGDFFKFYEGYMLLHLLENTKKWVVQKEKGKGEMQDEEQG